MAVVKHPRLRLSNFILLPVQSSFSFLTSHFPSSRPSIFFSSFPVFGLPWIGYIPLYFTIKGCLAWCTRSGPATTDTKRLTELVFLIQLNSVGMDHSIVPSTTLFVCSLLSLGFCIKLQRYQTKSSAQTRTQNNERWSHKERSFATLSLQ